MMSLDIIKAAPAPTNDPLVDATPPDKVWGPTHFIVSTSSRHGQTKKNNNNSGIVTGLRCWSPIYITAIE